MVLYLANQTQSSSNIYRGQQLSVAELETLKNAEGGLIFMNSFISATKKYDVAAKFARRSVGQAGLKPVIFEICIDRYDGEHDQQPFADITGESWYGEGEAEILLCMRTVMHIESVSIEEPTARIRLRLCRNDHVAGLNCDTDSPLLMYDSSNLLDGRTALFKMLMTLMSIGEYHRAEQMLSIMQSSEDSPESNVLYPYAVIIEMAQVNVTDPNAFDKLQTQYDQLRKYCQTLSDRESLTDNHGFAATKAVSIMNRVQQLTQSGKMSKFDGRILMRQQSETMKAMGKWMIDFKQFPWHSSLCDSLSKWHDELDTEKESNSVHISTADFDLFESDKDAKLSEEHPSQILFLLYMASMATDNGEYDQAIEFIRNGLSIPCTNDHRVLLYNQLTKIHEKQGNWFEAIKSHQQIINMLQLPPNSSAIIEAHVQCGNEYSEIKEFSQAYNCYAKALDLQLQHYPHDHLRTSKIYIKIGDCYEKLRNVTSALENYQKAISTGHPETASDAYH